MKSPRGSLTDVLGLCLMVAIIANGLGLYLKKTGFLERARYTERMTYLRCVATTDTIPAGPERKDACSRWSGFSRSAEAFSTEYLYRSTGMERLLKSLKDLFGVLIIATAALLLLSGRARLPGFATGWPVYLLLGSFSLSWVIALWTQGPWVAAAGLRTWTFPAIALATACVAVDLARLAQWMLWTLVIEMSLIPLEVLYGIPVHYRSTERWGLDFIIDRVSGTLILPNSLGSFAIIAAALYFTYARTPRYRAPVLLAAAVTAMIAGSGTGLIGVALIAGACWGKPLIERRGRSRLAATVVCGSVFAAWVLLLPRITGRPELAQSAIERVLSMVWALPNRPIDMIAGRGLGVGSNIFVNLISGGYTAPKGPEDPINLDSSVASLLLQTGVLGVAAFYGALLWAIRRYPAEMVFYGIAGFVSLTTNLPEFFPGGILLALTLGQGIRARPPTWTLQNSRQFRDNGMSPGLT